MKILVYGINYYPELTGIGKYTGEMCEWLAAKGHKVEVITAMPYYPSWKVQDDYVGKKWHVEHINGVKVNRVPIYVTQRVNAKTRILHELSFLVSSKMFWLKKMFTGYDVVISIYPPLVIGLFPYIYKLFHNKPWIFHVQDLQVDAANELGMIKSPFILNLLLKLEKLFLRKSSRVSSISAGMKNKIIKKGVKESNYLNLPNWVDTEFIKPLPKEESLKAELGFSEEEKVVLYSGNLGEKQGLEMIIKVAEKLQFLKNVVFVLAGEGAAKKRLQAMAEKLKLNNVRFLSLMPYNKLTRFMNMADIHLVLQKKEAADLVLPSKLNTILAAGGVVIVSASKSSTLHDLVYDNQIGIVIEPESESALQGAIEDYIFNSNEEIKKNARIFAMENMNIDRILGKFETELRSLKVSYKNRKSI